MKSDSKKRLSLSSKGEELIEHYKNMVDHGYQTQLFKIWNNAQYDNLNEYSIKFE